MFFGRVVFQQSSARELLRGEVIKPEPHELYSSRFNRKLPHWGLLPLFLMHSLPSARIGWKVFRAGLSLNFSKAINRAQDDFVQRGNGLFFQFL